MLGFGFQSSIAPKSDRNLCDLAGFEFNALVPILDRPEERPQYLWQGKDLVRGKVPILDRPEERPQFKQSLNLFDRKLFQSSIAPKSDRNDRLVRS